MTLESRRVVLTTKLPGRASAYESSEVRPQVTGIIQKRLFTEGETVEQGETLYQIDARLYRAALAQARADLQGAEASEVAARETAKRIEALSVEGLASALELAEVRAAAGVAAARVEQARAALESARINLKFTEVPAPIDGRIGRSLATTGALVTAGQPQPLTTIQRLDPIFVDLQQSSTELIELRRSAGEGLSAGSTEVKLELEDGSAYGQLGTLQFSEAMVDPSTGSVTLRARFPNPEHLLLPGMYVRAVVEQGERANGILAPQRGITRDNTGQAMAFVLDAEERVVRRSVVTERTVGEDWLIRSGLSSGDRLIVQGTNKVKPGQVVKPVPYTEAPEASGSTTEEKPVAPAPTGTSEGR